MYSYIKLTGINWSKRRLFVFFWWIDFEEILPFPPLLGFKVFPLNKTVFFHFFHGGMWEELNVKNTPQHCCVCVRIRLPAAYLMSSGCLPGSRRWPWKSWRLSSRTGSWASEVEICRVLPHTTRRLENPGGYHPGQDPRPARSRSASSCHTQQHD